MRVLSFQVMVKSVLGAWKSSLFGLGLRELSLTKRAISVIIRADGA